MEESPEKCLTALFQLCPNLTSFRLGTPTSLRVHGDILENEDAIRELEAKDRKGLRALPLLHLQSTGPLFDFEDTMATFPSLKTFKCYYQRSEEDEEPFRPPKNKLEQLRFTGHGDDLQTLLVATNFRDRL